MPFSDKARRGQERISVDQQNFDNALEGWVGAPEEKKRDWALAILSNVAAMGSKLDQLVDPTKAQEIKFDAQQSKK